MVATPPGSTGNRQVPTPPPGTFNPDPGALGGTQLAPYTPPGTSEPAPVQGPQPVTVQPGTDLYDWQEVNKALIAAGLNNWVIAGGSHQPINQGKWVKNPDWASTGNAEADAALNEGKEQYIWQAGNDFIIGVTNPATGQMLKVTLGRQGDPKTGYSYLITNREDTGKIDKVQGGYTGVQRLPFADGHEELWGTNSTTGTFEKMPQPEGLGSTKGWNDVKQIDDGQGHLIWVGTNPQGQPMQPVPGAPGPINTAKYVPGSVKQVTKTVNGVTKQVYVGQNAQTQQWEDIPELGTETVPIKTTTVGGVVYKDNPKAGQPGEPDFVRAAGIAAPNNGDKQWADAGGGYVKRQIYQNGSWSDVGPDDPEGTWRPVNPSTVAAQAATDRALGALKPKGTRYFVPLTGSPDTLIEVTADGNGGYTYEMGPNGEPPQTKRIPGIQQPQTVTGAGTEEFLPQRRDPYTQQLLPLERNPNWSPAGAGDRVRQLQDQARAKQQDLHAQVVAGALTEDAANKQFNDWWDTSIEPAKQEIQFAQQTKQQELARANLATAQTAANAITTATSGEHRVGPGFGAALANIQNSFASGKFPTPMSAQDLQNALVTPAPDYNKIYEQATAQALAHISPTAAQIATGQPIPTGGLTQNMDLTASLTPNRYAFGAQAMPQQGGPPPMQAMPQQGGPPPQLQNMAGGAPPPPVTAPVAPPASAFPTAPQTDWYTQLQARMAADRAEQLRQSQVQFPTSWNAWGNYQSPV